MERKKLTELVGAVVETQLKQTGEQAQIGVITEEVVNAVMKALYSQSPAEVAEMVAGCINRFGFGDKEFAQSMARQHKTLQQSFTRLTVAWFDELAGTVYCDPRNEGSVDLAKALTATEAWENKCLPMI